MHEPPEIPSAAARRASRVRRGRAPQIQLADGSQVAVHRARPLSLRDRIALAAHCYASGLREVAAETAEACREWCESFWMD